MKIALVVPGGVDRSGEYRVIPALLALIKRLARHHEVHAFAFAQEPAPGSWDLAAARIHNIGSRFTVLRAIAAICRESGSAPFHIVHSIWSGWPGFIAVTAAKVLRIPSLVHVAGGELVSLPEIGYGGGLHWYGRAREAFVLRSATAVSAASGPIIESIAALGIQAHRVPLGVDLEAWPPRNPVRREAAGAARLIHVASLNRVKDQATLLRALAALDATDLDFHMDIVGEDTLRGEIEAMAARLGLAAKTTFHGFLPQRKLRPLMEAAHVNVISSRHEAGPLVMLEAAVAGVPTVGTAVGHIADWAPAAALSVPVGDAAQLASAIERLLGDEALRLQIAGEASQRARAQDADYTADRFLRLYGELISRQASR
jgi:glycosyltransferase involved in cell wall biosynthesis